MGAGQGTMNVVSSLLKTAMYTATPVSLPIGMGAKALMSACLLYTSAQCHTDIPNGLLISGIPGSGKSLMAKTAAYKLGLPLISLDMGALLNSLMGESEHNMINALRMSENMAPCVLWIDEIEKAFSGSSQNSSSSDGGVGRRMFGKFLTWMQEKTCLLYTSRCV